MNKMFFIGLGKCASSKLQKDIFQKIAEFINYDYSGNENIVKNKNDVYVRLNSYHINCLLLDRKVERLSLNENMIISNEGLSSYRQPQYYRNLPKKLRSIR